VIVDIWEESLLLSEIIDIRFFKTISGEGKKGLIIAMWLYFQPDEPPDSAECTPTPKQPKKKGKARPEIKKEAVDKRLRSAGSVEPNTPAKRPLIGQLNVATRARGME
jgi:hypothetical protein